MATQVCGQCGAQLIPGARFCRVCGAKTNPSPSRSSKRPRSRRRSQAPRRRILTPFTLVAAGSLLLLAVGLLFLLDQERPAPAASTLPDTHDEEGIPYPEVPRIPLAEAKARFDSGTAIFVDVRTQGEYETAHIPNAISLPLADLEVRYQELPRDAEIITYCT